MRLNLSLLRGSNNFLTGTAGTIGSASNGKALVAPTGIEVSRDGAGPDPSVTKSCPIAAAGDQHWLDMEEVIFPAVPASSRFCRDSKDQHRKGLPTIPVVPTDDGILACKFANNPLPIAKATPYVLTFELDGARVICIDALSTTLEQSIAELRQRFHGRVGRIWQQDLEVGIK